MGKTRITVDCIDQRLIVTNDPLLASGGRNEDEIEFNFCPLWDGFGKTAVFYRTLEDVYNAPIVDSRCVVPAEVLKEKGEIFFGVFGSKDDVIRTTEVIKYNVVQGALLLGNKPAEPTPDIYTQLMTRFGEVDQRLTDIEGNMTPEGIGAEPKISALPVPKGGTGATDRQSASCDLSAAPNKADSAESTDIAFSVGWDTLNSPISTYGVLMVYKPYDNWVVQIWASTDPTKGDVFVRKNTNGTGFGEWYRLYTATDVVPVKNGGTGASDAEGARSALGVTPDNIGAVKKTGDTMTGDLHLPGKALYAESLMTHSTEGKPQFVLIYGGDGSVTFQMNNPDWSSDNYLRLYYDATVLGKPLAINSGGTGATDAAGAVASLWMEIAAKIESTYNVTKK